MLSPNTNGFARPVRRLLEPHLPLQPRLRALLSRRRRHASGRHGELRRSQRARHRGMLQGHRRNRRVRARVHHDPDRRRAALASRHPRDRQARVGAWTVGRRRHQRREDHRERGDAPQRRRSAGPLALARCARSRSPRRLQESARRLAKHRGGGGDPQQDRAPLHRADDRRLAQSRRARRDRRLRVRAPGCQGLESLLPGTHGTRAVRVGHHPGTVRRSSRIALPDPGKVQPADARQREVRSALHQDRAREWRLPDQDLLRRGRRVPGGHALHGDTAKRRCHALPIPPGLRGISSQRESRGPLDVLGVVHRHSPTHLARRSLRRVRDERPLRRLPRAGLRDDGRSDVRGSALHAHARDVRRAPLFSPSADARPSRGRSGRQRSNTAPNRRRPSSGTMRPPSA